MFALYIHWPFCQSKCPYCDFNSHVRENIDHLQWQKALLSELEHSARQLSNRKLDSIFFGGGTPSLMPPSVIEAIIKKAMDIWQPSDNMEITMEANPSSVEAARFKDYANAGINRVSIGVQSFDDMALKSLGREHSGDDAKHAIDIATKFFSRYSFDLIYARPQQKLDAWENELSQALTLAGNHLSLYQLTIEKGTAFHSDQRLGKLIMPDEDLSTDFYKLTKNIMSDAGFLQYEISNFATLNQESRHNLIYWRYGDYVGIGPGAHSRITIDGDKFATRRHRLPEKWLDTVENHQYGMAENIKINIDDQLKEMLLMGLRLDEGVKLNRIETLMGQKFSQLINDGMIGGKPIQDLIEADFITIDNERISVTDSGRQRLNMVLAYMLSN